MELAAFHPVVRNWFENKFGAPTEPQRRGWPAIAAGQDTLIAAPTGSGKTLAAFLACIDRLVRRGLAAPAQTSLFAAPEGVAESAGPPDGISESAGLPDGVEVVYVSPLRALGNDIERNLRGPLAEIREVARDMGYELPDIRVAVRSGDTPATERARMLRRPPHILITTPESLYILLTADKSRAALARARTVIVDEIHAVAASKRGSHLALTLERLDRLVAGSDAEPTGRPRPVRVGLSATQKPIELVGRLLVGSRRPLPTIIDGGHARALDLAIELPPGEELCAVASTEQSQAVYDRIAELIREHDTTLVFVNTRKLVERVAHALTERLGEDQVVAHHGSMARHRRFDAEQKLKHGEVKVAVATASLELGIDVGVVDLVVQIGSPRSIATFLQRVGRSGHSLGATPKGRLFAMTRDQLVECAALVRALRAGELDRLELRPKPLDILAQHIVAASACEDWGEDELFEFVRGAVPYCDLERSEFDAVLAMLGEGVVLRKGRSSARVHRDRVNGRVRGRRGARLAAITSGGAIPDAALYQVIAFPDEARVGTLDEDFAIESMPGDIFALGNTSWRVRRVTQGKVLVEDARGLPPNIPFWFGEAPARTAELSAEVAAVRDWVDRRLVAGDTPADMARELADTAALGPSGAEQVVAYLTAGRAALGGSMPTTHRIVAERFFDDGGGMQLVIHAPLGARINKAWGLALRKKFCATFDFELQAAATDDGLLLSLGPMHSFPLITVFDYVSPATLKKTLVQALLTSPIFPTRWRWNATRSLSILRFAGGKKVPPFLIRMRSDDLLASVFPEAQACQENIVGPRELPDHPLVDETVRDCTTEFMDVDGLAEVLHAIKDGRIEIVARDTAEPSPLCHELINANPYAFLDDAPLEERRTRAVSLRRSLPADQSELGALDEAAIDAVTEQVAPAVRSADELHDALLSLVWTRPRGDATWAQWFRELVADRRAVTARWPRVGADVVAWVAAETAPLVRAVVPEVVFEPEPAELPDGLLDHVFDDAHDDANRATRALSHCVRGHLDARGPVTAAVLARDLGLEPASVEAALLSLESEGQILRGHFSQRLAEAGRADAASADDTNATGDAASAPPTQWCDRRILARIHRLTLGRLRREIEPVTPADFMRFLFDWHGVGDGKRLHGQQAVDRVVEQLQGFESAAGAWEAELLPARVQDYQPAWLDQLCWSGDVVWGRLSPKPKADNADDRARRPSPTRSAPITLALRDDTPWLRRAPAVDRDRTRSRPSASPVELCDGGGAAASTSTVDRVADLLAARGATFAGEIAAALGAEPTAVENALWELVATGRATADGFACLRALLDKDRATTPQRARARRGRWRPDDAVRRLDPVPFAGRWSLLDQADVAGADRDDDVTEACARQLLARYGVVFRDLLARESCLPPWRELLLALRRLEGRGEIRGGRFVSGMVGEQFALPEAVDALRAVRRRKPAQPEFARIAATDPLNLVGITSPGPRVPAVLGNAVLYCNGVPIASREAGALVERTAAPDRVRLDSSLRVYLQPEPAAVS